MTKNDSFIPFKPQKLTQETTKLQTLV